MIGIYKITSPSNKVYIGQSLNIYKRWKQHTEKHNLSKANKLYKSFLKYGFQNHKFEILELCDKEDLNKNEVKWKTFYKNLNKDNILFHEIHDQGGGPKSEETKTKISRTLSQNIIQYDLEGNFIKEWESKRDISKFYKGDIYACCRHTQKTASGFIWRYKEDNNINVCLINKHKNRNKSKKWIQSRYKAVIQYDLEGNFIKEWESLQELKKHKYCYPLISKCCNKKLNNYKKYIWEWKNKDQVLKNH